jgi:hypothetical protein
VHRCTPEFYGILERTCQEGAPAKFIGSKRNLKVVEYLGGEDCVEEGTKKTELLKVL